MKKLYIFICLLIATVAVKAQSTYHVHCADLFISEYAEPGTGLSGSKAIEIYNPTANTINLANYTLTVYYNQCTGNTDSFKLPPVNLLSHHVYVIIGGISVGTVDPTLSAVADTSWSQLIFNGNDAIALFAPNYDTLDIFGVPCALPNTVLGWVLPTTGAKTNDITLVRQPWVLNGERNWNVGQYQWDTFAVNNFSHFGWHTMYPCGYHPTVSFSTLADSVIESVGNYQIPLTLQYPNGDTTFVTVHITGGTATANADYTTSATQVLIFPPYSQLATSYIANDSIHIIDDLIPEPTETITYKILSTSNASSVVDTVNGHHTLNILDNDFAPEFDFVQPTYMAVNENVGTILLPVQLNAAPATPYSVTVAVNLAASTTQPADYIFSTQTITFPAGKQYDTVAFTIVNDCITEGIETAVLQLYNPTNGATIGTDSVMIIDINANDSLPNILFPTTTSYIESAGNITIPVALSNRYCDTVIVYTNINPIGTATWNVDYNNIPQTDSLIFYPGDSLKFISLSIIDDNIQEPTESIVIDISTTNAGVTTVYGSTTVLIQDNDGPPVYNFMQPVIKFVNETNTTYQIAVTANGAVGATPYTVNVDFDAAHSTATLNSDFTFTNQTVIFSSPKDTQYVSLSIIDDCLPEGLEAIKLKLRNAFNGSLGIDSTYTMNINPNDTLPVANIIGGTTSIVENGGSAFIVVGLNHPYCDTVKVQVNLANGTAMAGSDYNNANYPMTIVFPPLTSGPDTVWVPIVDDTIFELNEWYFYSINALTNCTATNTIDSTIILDNDVPTVNPSVEFQITSGAWIESAGTVNIPITITNPNNAPTSITVSVTGGTATLGADYTATSPQVLTFPASSTTTINYSLSIIDDLITEPNETFTLVLSNATNNASVGLNNTFTGTIIDNDQVVLPSVQFNNISYNYIESAGTVTLPITVSNPNNSNVYFGYTLSGSATLGADYTVVSNNPVSVVASYSNSNIQVNIVDDNLVESPENIVITLNAVSNCTIGNNISATITIIDNDTTAQPQPSGVNNVVKNNIKIYPNPVSASVSIHIVGNDDNAVFELYNLLGQKSFSESINNHVIDLSKFSLNTGVYFYKINTSEGLIKEGKLVIK